MTDYINALPHELLAMIFSYIDRKELIKHTQNVCAKWRKIVRESGFLWTNFLYGPEYNESIEKMTKFLTDCPMVQNIYFHYANHGAVGQIIAEHCSELRKLLFIGHNPVAVSYLELDAILTRNVHLEKLGVYIENSEEAVQIAKRIGKVKNLKYLELVGPQGVVFPSRPLAEGCKLLNELNIHTQNFSTEDLVYLLGNMKSHLLKLIIKGEFRSEVMAAIGELLKIQELRIEEFAGIQNRIKNVSHLKQLKTLTKFSLSVGWCGTSCSDSQIFESVLNCQWTELTELFIYLHRCDDKPEKLRYLGNVYPKLKTLYLVYKSLTQQNVDASWCGRLLELDALTLIGVWEVDDALFNSLRTCQKLWFVRIPEAKGVTDESISSIATLGNLHSLELRECPMTKAGKHRLKQLMPNTDFYITRHFK